MMFADNIDGAIIGQPVIPVTADTRVRVYTSRVKRRGSVCDDGITLRVAVYDVRPGVPSRLLSLWVRGPQGWQP